MATNPSTRDISSSALLLRRSKSVAGINCKVASRCSLASEVVFSPERLMQNAGKPTQVLADQSPLAGPVGKALLEKRKQRRGSAPAFLLDEQCKDADSAIAEVGFHRFVYQKVRKMRDERVDSHYESLKDAVLDIMHAVRVCSQATRFISHVKTSCEPTLTLGDSAQKVAKCKWFREASTKCFGDYPKSPLRSDALLDRKWRSLLEGLSPMTPQVQSWMICSPSRLVLPPLYAKGNGLQTIAWTK